MIVAISYVEVALRIKSSLIWPGKSSRAAQPVGAATFASASQRTDDVSRRRGPAGGGVVVLLAAQQDSGQ